MAPTGSEGEGNTKPLPRITASKNWCFTLNNYTDEMLALLAPILELNKYIYGFEVGEQGTPHLQGYVEFTDKKRPSEYIKIKQIHWTKSKGTRDENITYCSKDGNYKTNFIVKRPLKKLICEDESKQYKWQKDILKIISEEPDDRTIHWFWESDGCAGKTTFAKFLTRKYEAVPLEGKKNDILYCAAEFESNIYIYDIERSLEDYVSYGAIEKIKNGYYMCAKYESKPIDRNPPHVIIFANFKPDMSNLSEDRWHIVEIKK